MFACVCVCVLVKLDNSILVLFYWLQLPSITNRFMLLAMGSLLYMCPIHFMAILLKIVHPASSGLKLVLSDSEMSKTLKIEHFVLPYS